ncbi:MAG: acetyl-CoA carboxylase biotin carboxyl carrier protein [Candidatus Neomarinimicrobiota bacterium]|nr:acetyl-CoA carboxylase biotin carboxyl carrier protein [Candidatus Neomarinimicrobiota bacterium]
MLRGLSDMFEGWKSRLQTIIDLLESSEVNEIEVSFFGRKYRVSKGAVPEDALKPVQAENVVATPVVNASELQPTGASVPAGIEVTSPMVGTFYCSSSPESPPFVNEGDHVTTGQTLCIIEAMKIMNEIESEVTGRITRVFGENGQAVEYGQTLFVVEPD